jgi:hypothetical protein
MRAFCTLLEEIEHDATIADLLKVAMSGDDDSVPVRSLISCLNSRLKYRNSAVQAMYKRIAGARSAYVLGAARIYRYLWEFQGKYAICVAGMVRLLYFPISYSQVSADMRTRRHSTNIIAGQACDVSVTA